MELEEVKRSETDLDKDSYFIKNESVMTSSLDVLTTLSSNKYILFHHFSNLFSLGNGRTLMSSLSPFAFSVRQ